MIEMKELSKVSKPDPVGAFPRRPAGMGRMLSVLLLAVTLQSHASMYGATHPSHQGPQKVTRSREEFQKLAIQKVRGETPEILRGIRLDRPIYRVEVTVDEAGNVAKTHPLAGDALLAEAALVAATKWRFPPQQVNAKPAIVVSAVDVEFQNREEQRGQDRLGGAIQELQRSPDLAASYYNVGFAYQVGHRYKEASEYFQKAIQLAPDWPVAHAALGDAYYGLNKYEEAVACFRRAPALKLDYFEPYVRIGWCYTRLKREWEALNAFLQAAEQAKSSDDKVGVGWNLVRTYKSLGQNEDAADAQMQVANHAARYSAVEQLSPFDPSKEAFLAAVSYERLGKTEKAIGAYRLAIDSDPLTDAGLLARIMVAGYLRRDNKLDQSTALLKEMVSLADDAIRDYAANKNKYGLGCAYYWRGNARRDLGQLQEALEDLRKAVKYRPDWGEAHLRLAYAYLRAGDLQSARKEYRTSGIVDESLTREIESASLRPQIRSK